MYHLNGYYLSLPNDIKHIVVKCVLELLGIHSKHRLLKTVYNLQFLNIIFLDFIK